MAKHRKKRRTHVRIDRNDELAKGTPKSFVIRSGDVGKSVGQLVRDVRKLFEPNTATKLKERRNNHLKDFVQVAGQLGVTHYLVFSRKDVQRSAKIAGKSTTVSHTNLRIARHPKGPSLTFRVNSYALTSDVIHQKNSKSANQKDFTAAPLLVLNGFTGQEKETQLMVSMFQNMFPALDVANVKLAQTKRVVLVSLNKTTNTIDVRHYSISVSEPKALDSHGDRVARKLSKVLSDSSRLDGDLSKLEDISDLILAQDASESEYESNAEENTVEITVEGKKMFKSKKPVEAFTQQRAVKLYELGPRMSLQLLKITSGLFDEGSVLYHAYIKKSAAEIKEQERKIKEKEALKQQRRKEQEANIEKKKQEKEEHRRITSEGGLKGVQKRKAESDESEASEEGNWQDEEIHDSSDDSSE